MLKHEEWLSHAKQDLLSAEILYNSNQPVIGSVLFHTQQCAEKALKAFLVFKKLNPQKTHDLIALTETCILINQEFKVLLIAVAELNPYQASTRYPDTHYPLLDLSIAKEAIACAKLIYDFIEFQINQQD